MASNLKFLRRCLAIPAFRSWDYDTSFVEQYEDILLRKTRKKSHFRKGSMAIVHTYLSTQNNRSKRRAQLDPWLQKDMFRMNHRSLRPLEIIDEEEGTREEFLIEYIKEDTFNAFVKDENGFLVTVLINGQVSMNPDVPDEVIVRTDSEQYKVDFYIDENHKVTQLDYEGYPLTVVSNLA